MATKANDNSIYNFHFSFSPANQPEYWDIFEKLCQKLHKFHYDLNAYNLEQLKARQTLFSLCENNWYTATLSAPNPDFLAFIYKYSKNLPLPIIFGFDIQIINNFCNGLIRKDELIHIIENLTILLRQDDGVISYLQKYVNRWIYDQNKITKVLEREGYLKNGDLIREPKNYFLAYEKSRQYIFKHDYHHLEILFLEIIDHKVNGENYKENLYFKRLNSSQITAKDILPFWSKSKNSEIVNDYFEEYILCIDEVLLSDKNNNEKRLQEILSKYSPHIDELLNPTQNNFVYFQDGIVLEVNNNEEEQSIKYLESIKSIPSPISLREQAF